MWTKFDVYCKFTDAFIWLQDKFFLKESTYDLQETIVKYTVNKMRKFRELNDGYPPHMSENKWDKILGEITYSFEHYVEFEKLYLLDEKYEKEYKKINKGFALFGKYFKHLWW